MANKTIGPNASEYIRVKSNRETEQKIVATNTQNEFYGRFNGDVFLKKVGTEGYENIKDVIDRATQNIFKKYIVEVLPNVNEADPKGLYLLKQGPSPAYDQDLCLEYTVVETDDGKEWELVGGDRVDLSNYYTKDEVYAKGEVYTKGETDVKTSLTPVEGKSNGYTLGNNDDKKLQKMLSDDQITAIDWSIEHRQDILKEEAMSKYSVTTSGSCTYNADEATQGTLTVTVTTKFDGVLVDSTPPSGWNATSTGTFTKTAVGSGGTSVPVANFKYTPDEGKYKGIEVNGNSQAKSISVTYPCYHGFVTGNEYSQYVQDGVLDISSLGLKRSTTRVQDASATLLNGNNESAYYWILTHNTATATQMGTSILKQPVTVTLKSPQAGHGDITMGGYKIYISEKSAARNSSFDNVNRKINI